MYSARFITLAPAWGGHVQSGLFVETCCEKLTDLTRAALEKELHQRGRHQYRMVSTASRSTVRGNPRP
jgi:hypothetical protein